MGSAGSSFFSGLLNGIGDIKQKSLEEKHSKEKEETEQWHRMIEGFSRQLDPNSPTHDQDVARLMKWYLSPFGDQDQNKKQGKGKSKTQQNSTNSKSTINPWEDEEHMGHLAKLASGLNKVFHGIGHGIEQGAKGVGKGLEAYGKAEIAPWKGPRRLQQLDPQQIQKMVGSTEDRAKWDQQSQIQKVQTWTTVADAIYGPTTPENKDKKASLVKEGVTGRADKDSDVSGRTMTPSDVLTRDTVADLIKRGRKFPDEQGKNIGAEDMPDGVGLRPVIRGNRIYYEFKNLPEVTTGVGGGLYVSSQYDRHNIGNDPNSYLGPQRGGYEGSRDLPTVDADGNVTVNSYATSRTPVVTPIGRTGPGATQTTPPQPNTGSAPRTTRPGQPTSSTSPSTLQGNTPQVTRVGGSVIRGIPAGHYDTMLKRVTPVREAVTQFFGDPKNPDLRGLDSFSKLADNKDSQKRLGTAFQIIFNGLSQDTKGAHIDAKAGPISVGTGGIGEVLQNYFHVPQELADQRASIIRDVISKLSPEEQDYVNAAMSSFGVAVGLRSLSNASAAQASVDTIERELPLIGLTTPNGRAYDDKMSRLAEITRNGMLGVPKSMIDKELLDRINGLGKKKVPGGRTGATIKMVAPNGQVKDVPEDQVKHYESLGAKRQQPQ